MDYPDIALAVARAVRAGRRAAGHPGRRRRASGRPWPPTRCPACARPCAPTRRPPATRASTTTRTCWPWAAKFVNAPRCIDRRDLPHRALHRGAPRPPRGEDQGHRGVLPEDAPRWRPVPRRAPRARDPRRDRPRPEEAPCACHSAPGGCCPDRLGRLVAHGAERFGMQAGAT